MNKRCEGHTTLGGCYGEFVDVEIFDAHGVSHGRARVCQRAITEDEQKGFVVRRLDGVDTYSTLREKLAEARAALRHLGCYRRDDGHVLHRCYAGGTCPCLVDHRCTALEEP